MFDRINKRLNAYVNKLRSKVDEARSKYRYSFAVRLFRLSTLPSSVSSHLGSNATIYGTIAFILLSAVSISFITNLAGTVGISDQRVVDFLNASATMIGSMLAIVFTFNTLIVSFAVDQYPPEFYRLSGYNKRLDILYFALAGLTLGQFSLGVIFNKDNHLNRTIITALGLLFVFMAVYLLFIAFIIVRRKMNPASGLQCIYDFAIRNLNNAAKYIKRDTEVLGLNPNLTNQERQLLPQTAYINLHGSYQDLSAYLRYLFGYHTKLVEKSDFEMALQVIDAITAIIVKYIEVNRQCIPLIPQPGVFTSATTMAEKFFSDNYERMAEKTMYYVRQDNELGITKMASKYVEIGQKLSNLEFSQATGVLRSENPEFSRCLGYISMLMDEIVATGSINATYRFTEVFMRFGELSIAQQRELDITVVQQNLEKAAGLAAVKRSNVIHQQVANAYIVLATKHIDHLSHERFISSFFESLNITTKLFLASMTNADFRLAADFARPYELFAGKALHHIPTASNPVNQDRYDIQLRIILYANQIYEGLMGLNSDISMIDKIIVLDYARVLEALMVGLLPNIQKQTWTRSRDQLESGLEKLARVFGWFTRDAKTVKFRFIDTVAEHAGRVAFVAVQEGQDDIAFTAAQSIALMAEILLSGGVNALFEAPRTMLLVVLLIVECLTFDNIKLAARLKKIVRDFNDHYIAKIKTTGLWPIAPNGHPSQPYPEQLFFEFKEVVRRLSNSSLQRADPGVEELLRTVNGVSIDHYIATFKYLRR